MVLYEWDPVKARANQQKHDISFDDAMHVFEDPYALFNQERIDEAGELRWLALGFAEGAILLVVVHTVRGGNPFRGAGSTCVHQCVS